MTHLEKAIQIVGTQRQLASKLDVQEGAVSQWKKHGVPAKRCRPIQELTDNKITVHDLRPDIFGPKPTSTEAA